MNKEEFLRQLAQLLADVPQSERTEALNYYEEYFTDAGVENEQQVLLEVGSPWQVAQTIREGLQPGMISDEKDVQSARQEKKGLPAWAVVLLVIACVLGSPIILVFAVAVLGILIGLFAAVLGLIIAFAAAGIAMVVAGVALLIMGVINCAAFPAAGMTLAGASLIVFAVGVLGIMLMVWLCGFVLPALCRGVACLFRKSPSKKESI